MAGKKGVLEKSGELGRTASGTTGRREFEGCWGEMIRPVLLWHKVSIIQSLHMGA